MLRARPTVMALALLALIFNATALAWHVPSGSKASAAEADLQAALLVDCHGGQAATDKHHSNHHPGSPNPAKQDCPICMGLAAVGPAILGAMPVLWFDIGTGPAAPPYADARRVQSAVPVLRNRGPPRLV